jgi:hypothetical protein
LSNVPAEMATVQIKLDKLFECCDKAMIFYSKSSPYIII